MGRDRDRGRTLAGVMSIFHSKIRAHMGQPRADMGIWPRVPPPPTPSSPSSTRSQQQVSVLHVLRYEQLAPVLPPTHRHCMDEVASPSTAVQVPRLCPRPPHLCNCSNNEEQQAHHINLSPASAESVPTSGSTTAAASRPPPACPWSPRSGTVRAG